MELIGECKGNNGNGCFMDSCGHDCGCFTIQERSYSAKDMINFVEFVSQYYADDSMENSSIYELLKQFKNK